MSVPVDNALPPQLVPFCRGRDERGKAVFHLDKYFFRDFNTDDKMSLKQSLDCLKVGSDNVSLFGELLSTNNSGLWVRTNDIIGFHVERMSTGFTLWLHEEAKSYKLLNPESFADYEFLAALSKSYSCWDLLNVVIFDCLSFSSKTLCEVDLTSNHVLHGRLNNLLPIRVQIHDFTLHVISSDDDIGVECQYRVKDELENVYRVKSFQTNSDLDSLYYIDDGYNWPNEEEITWRMISDYSVTCDGATMSIPSFAALTFSNSSYAVTGKLLPAPSSHCSSSSSRHCMPIRVSIEVDKLFVEFEAQDRGFWLCNSAEPDTRYKLHGKPSAEYARFVEEANNLFRLYDALPLLGSKNTVSGKFAVKEQLELIHEVSGGAFDLAYFRQNRDFLLAYCAEFIEFRHSKAFIASIRDLEDPSQTSVKRKRAKPSVIEDFDEDEVWDEPMVKTKKIVPTNNREEVTDPLVQQSPLMTNHTMTALIPIKPSIMAAPVVSTAMVVDPVVVAASAAPPAPSHLPSDPVVATKEMPILSIPPETKTTKTLESNSPRNPIDIKIPEKSNRSANEKSLLTSSGRVKPSKLQPSSSSNLAATSTVNNEMEPSNKISAGEKSATAVQAVSVTAKKLSSSKLAELMRREDERLQSSKASIDKFNIFSSHSPRVQSMETVQRAPLGTDVNDTVDNRSIAKPVEMKVVKTSSGSLEIPSKIRFSTDLIQGPTASSSDSKPLKGILKNANNWRLIYVPPSVLDYSYDGGHQFDDRVKWSDELDWKDHILCSEDSTATSASTVSTASSASTCVPIPENFGSGFTSEVNHDFEVGRTRFEFVGGLTSYPLFSALESLIADCSVCDRKGHSAETCLVVLSKQRTSHLTFRDCFVNRQHFGKYCVRCDSIGHTMKECQINTLCIECYQQGHVAMYCETYQNELLQHQTPQDYLPTYCEHLEQIKTVMATTVKTEWVESIRTLNFCINCGRGGHNYWTCKEIVSICSYCKRLNHKIEYCMAKDRRVFKQKVCESVCINCNYNNHITTECFKPLAVCFRCRQKGHATILCEVDQYCELNECACEHLAEYELTLTALSRQAAEKELAISHAQSKNSSIDNHNSHCSICDRVGHIPVDCLVTLYKAHCDLITYEDLFYGRKNFEIYCINCNASGHYSENCRTSFKCSLCKKLGHVELFCDQVQSCASIEEAKKHLKTWCQNMQNDAFSKIKFAPLDIRTKLDAINFCINCGQCGHNYRACIADIKKCSYCSRSNHQDVYCWAKDTDREFSPFVAHKQVCVYCEMNNHSSSNCGKTVTALCGKCGRYGHRTKYCDTIQYLELNKHAIEQNEQFRRREEKAMQSTANKDRKSTEKIIHCTVCSGNHDQLICMVVLLKEKQGKSMKSMLKPFCVNCKKSNHRADVCYLPRTRCTNCKVKGHSGEFCTDIQKLTGTDLPKVLKYLDGFVTSRLW